MDWETLGRIAGNIFLGFIEYIFKISATIAVGIVAMTSGPLAEKIGAGFGSLTQVFRKLFEVPGKISELSVMVEDYNGMTAAGFNQKYGTDAVGSLMAYLNGIIDYFQAVYYNLANEPVTTFLAALAVFSVFYVLGRVLQFARQRGQGSWLVRMERRLGERVFKTVPLRPKPAAAGGTMSQPQQNESFGSSTGFVPSTQRGQSKRTKNLSSPFNKYVKKSDKSKSKTKADASVSAEQKKTPAPPSTEKKTDSSSTAAKSVSGSRYSAYRLEEQTSILEKVTEKNLKLKESEVEHDERDASSELFSIEFEEAQDVEQAEASTEEEQSDTHNDVEEEQDTVVEEDQQEEPEEATAEIEAEDEIVEEEVTEKAETVNTEESTVSKKEKDLQKLLDDVENLKKEWKSEVGAEVDSEEPPDDGSDDEVAESDHEQEGAEEAEMETAEADLDEMTEEDIDDGIEADLESALQQENTNDLDSLIDEENGEASTELPDEPKIVYKAKEIFDEESPSTDEVEKSEEEEKESPAQEASQQQPAPEKPEEENRENQQASKAEAEKQKEASEKAESKPVKKKQDTKQAPKAESKKKSKKKKKAPTPRKTKKKSDPDPVSLMFAIEAARAKD